MALTIITQIIMAIGSVLLSIISYLISRNYSEMKTTLTKICNDIIETRLELTRLQASMLTDTRVKELIELELSKRNAQL